MKSTINTSIILFLFLLIFASCGRYLDKVSGRYATPLKQGYFDFYLDSNVLTYTSNIVLTRDKERVYPKHFRVGLPKGIKYYEIEGSTDFVIYYDNQQAIFIRVDLEKNAERDTVYTPKQMALENFIQNKLTLGGSNYDIKKIKFDKKRKNLFVKKGAATILLYNIKPNILELFYSFINTFSFIS